MTIAICNECQWRGNIEEITFVDYEGLPIVLSCQIEGVATKKRAWQYLEDKHEAVYSISDFEYEDFQFVNRSPRLSHDEPGSSHDLIGIPKGFWSFIG